MPNLAHQIDGLLITSSSPIFRGLANYGMVNKDSLKIWSAADFLSVELVRRTGCRIGRRRQLIRSRKER